MASTLPILISGAGISGLALAQGLLKAHIPFLVFERDPALNIRSQGYRVRINSDGISALHSVLPPHLFARLQDSCPHVPFTVPKLDALTGKALDIRLPSKDGNRTPVQNVSTSLNADREVLRSVLISGVEEFVVFGREVISFERREDVVVVKFSDGSEVKGSLLVGADGARSKIRKQLLPGRELVDTEGRAIYGKTVLTPELEEIFHPEALKGFTLVIDSSKELPLTLLAEPIRFKDNEFRKDLPADYIYWVLVTRKDARDLPDSTLLDLTSLEAAALAQSLTAHWDSSFHALFALQQTIKTSYFLMKSVEPEIPHTDDAGLVTLIGDSVHAMSPTAGVGAVVALRDAAMLAKLLTEEGINEGNLRKYEAAMREYAGAAITRSDIWGKMLFSMRPFAELTSVKA